MPKKILFESAVHQFLWAGSRLQARWRTTSPENARRLAAWLAALQIENAGPGHLRLAWSTPAPGEHLVAFQGAKFYTRGDTAAHAALQRERQLEFVGDKVMAANRAFFDTALRTALATARVFDAATLAAAAGDPGADATKQRQAAEEHFHDEWAAGEDVTKINVRQRNEACTAPEMRHLRRALGDLHGRTLLDVGCGLGEASVYFALEGARVTATDVSPGMCAATRRLADAQGVSVETNISAAEDLRLGTRQFDIIYIGNTLHHVDIATTMDQLIPHLRAGGTFVSWDPVAYNPIINVYRRIAMKVRTPDEHPLRLRDIRAVTARFATSELRWFWLTTLVIFLAMVFVQFRNPNRVRLWKQVIDDADRWRWLYQPLERLDTALLRLMPWLGPLCWNVVIVARSPRHPTPPSHA